MLRRHSLTGLVVFALTGLGLAPAVDDEIKGDLKAMQGSWIGSLSNGSTVTFKFEKKKATAVVDDSTFETETTLDESAEPHKTLDFKIEAGPPDAVGLTVLGIYKLGDENKKLTICVGAPGQPRPETFQEVDGEVYLFELDRDDK